MGKTISVYVDDQNLSALDRLAKSERRSRSSMLGEVIRRYIQQISGADEENNPYFRSFTSRELNEFLKEDGKIPPRKIKEYRKKLGLES